LRPYLISADVKWANNFAFFWKQLGIFSRRFDSLPLNAARGEVASLKEQP
jgi:hypothetical protein